MDKLIQAIVAEVCVNYGIKPGTPMPRAMQVNIEGRIKTYLAVILGIVDAQTVVDSMQNRLDLARRQDAHNGLTGPWYKGDNAKRLGD